MCREKNQSSKYIARPSRPESTAMNTPKENHDATNSDDLHDQLLDAALSELVGGAAPPDLSSRIAAAIFQHPAAVGQAPRTRQDRAFWVHLAIAVMLLIGVTTVLVNPFQSARKQAENAIASTTGTSSKPAELIDEFNRLNHEQRYAEAEPVARRLSQIAPDDPAAKQVSENAKFIRGEMSNRQSADNKETSLSRQLSAMEKSKIAAKQDRLGGRSEMAQTTVKSKSLNGGAAKPTSNLSLDALHPAVPATSPVTVPSQNTSETITWFTPVNETASRMKPSAAPTSNDTARFALINESAAATTRGLEPAPLATDSFYAYGDRRKDAVYGVNFSARGLDGKEIREELLDGLKSREGTGPGSSGDKYTQIIENPFVKAEGGAAVSTFSIDVDTASYSNVRQFLMQMNQLPPPDAVRIEELVNYFNYDYAGPPSAPGSEGSSATKNNDAPFAAHVEVASCPWNSEHRLARIGIKGREMDRNKRPQSNLVFLVDVSGSMNEPAKLPLVVYGLEQLTRELGENDHIAIVVYAGTEGLVLPSTSGSKQDTILAALAKLQAGGSTAGGAGIQLAYQIAEENFIKGGTNRVILCTDGDFNVGVTNTADLQQLVAKKAKDTGVFISTLGFGRGNLNDAMMVAISDHGNGNYHYIDNRTEARRVLVEEMTGTLVTIAKDVKIQVEFNPAKVAGYRLIGYEKRVLRTEDFNDDKKDAGEIGAGHTVTALYEIVPAGKKVDVAPVDGLKYQKTAPPSETVREILEGTDKELLTLKMRYKAPDGDTSKKLEWPITDDGKSFSAASGDLKFAASVAGLGLMLRNSQFKGNLTYAAVVELAQSGIGEDPHGYRKEFVEMVRKAKELRHE
jgi:Ca-activated chloride channel homolog